MYIETLKLAHRRMYSWVCHQWHDDVMEGFFLARFKSVTNAGLIFHVYAFLCRKLGKPQRLMWQLLFAEPGQERSFTAKYDRTMMTVMTGCGWLNLPSG